MDRNEVRELLEFSGECFNIPDLMYFLEGIAGRINLFGGGLEECLKEVEIALLALGKDFDIDRKWSY